MSKPHLFYLSSEERLVLLIAGISYALTSVHVILGGDHAEFVALSVTGGAAHPPGYPLYVLWLRLWHWIPLNPIWISALSTAFLGLLSLLLGFWAMRAWKLSAGALALSLYAWMPLTWNLYTHAEVFALNQVFAALFLLWFAPQFKLSKPKLWLGLLGLFTGLALTHHWSIVLLFPLAFGALDKFKAALSKPWLFLLGMLIGLLPLAYLWSGQGTWGPHIQSWSEFWHHITRADYGSTQLGISEHSVSPWVQIQTWLSHVFGWPMMLLSFTGLAGLWIALRKRPEFLTLAIVWMATGPFFLSLFNIAPQGLAFWVIERFYLLPLFIGAFFSALFFDAITPIWKAQIKRLPHLAQHPYWILLLLIWILSQWPELHQRQNPAVDRYLKNVIQSVPKHSAIVGTGDEKYFGFKYYLEIQKVKEDVVYVDLMLLSKPWYRQKLKGVLGREIQGATKTHVRIPSVLSDLRKKYTHLFLTQSFKGLEIPFYPYGALLALASSESSVPDPQSLLKLNQKLFLNFDLNYTFPSNPHTWSAHVHLQYGRTWMILARALTDIGDLQQAQKAQRQALLLMPWEK